MGKPYRKLNSLSSLSSFTTTVTLTLQTDHSATPSQHNTVEIPIQSPPKSPVPITVHLPQGQSDPSAAAAAAKIQSVYRAHRIRKLYKIISAVNSEADHLERLIQRQETVDAIRSEEKEKIRMNEALMGILLRLDSVPGIDPTLREGRRKVSRRIVGLQEILDGISEAKLEEGWVYGNCDGFVRNWDEVLGMMEEEICRERGGDEMERFCAEYLGFRCLRRFLGEP